MKLRPGEIAASETAGLRTAAAFRDELPTGLEFLRREVDAFVLGALADEGEDAENIPTRRRAQLEYRGRLHRRITQLDTKLELLGLTDRHNKLRVAWLGKLESMISTAVRIDGLLGLDRRAKQIESPAEWIERVSAARARTDDDHAASDDHASADAESMRDADSQAEEA